MVYHQFNYYLLNKTFVLSSSLYNFKRTTKAIYNFLTNIAVYNKMLCYKSNFCMQMSLLVTNNQGEP